MRFAKRSETDEQEYFENIGSCACDVIPGRVSGASHTNHCSNIRTNSHTSADQHGNTQRNTQANNHRYSLAQRQYGYRDERQSVYSRGCEG